MSETAQTFVDQYRKYFGLLPTRDRFKIRRDVFYELHLNDESQSDHEILKRLSNCLVTLTNHCFKQCVTLQYKPFTTEEEICVRQCVADYFGGYEKIVAETNRVLKE